MRPVETFNRQLNHSLKDRFDAWKDYRQQINQILKFHLQSNKPHQKMLILGGGNLNDLDLDFIGDYVQDLTITDVDLEALSGGIQHYHLNPNRIQLIATEFTGIEDTLFFEGLSEKLTTCKDIDCMTSYLTDQFQRLSTHTFLKTHEEIYDVILISPIYTQLLMMQTLEYLALWKTMGYPKDYLKQIEITMLDHMHIIIDQFNTNVKRLLRPQGILCALSDIFQAQKKSAFHQRILDCMHDPVELQTLYQSYVKMYGMGLGDYGLISLEDGLKPKQSSWLIWPHQDNIDILVRCVFLVKT